jgi:2,4'-dihydroxyacetophenone dioxygenase
MPPSATTNNATATNGNSTQKKDDKSMPYQLDQPYGMPNDLVIPNILNLAETDERLWVPQAPDVSFRPLLFNTSNGYFVNILRVKRSGILSRHKHTGPVHAFTLKGKWHYLEHDWWATEGGYSMEPPGETHTLEVPEGVEEMVTLFHVTGAYVYVDPYGKAERIEDVFTKLEMAREHYEKVGLGRDYVDQFIR